MSPYATSDDCGAVTGVTSKWNNDGFVGADVITIEVREPDASRLI
jgi:hypothetical protein